MRLTLVDVRAVGLLSGLGALLLLARWRRSLLAGLLLLGGSLASWSLAGGGWGLRENASERMRQARKCRLQNATHLGSGLWGHCECGFW